MTDYKQIFLWTNILKSEIKLFKISQNLLKFLGQHHILPYLFTNTSFKFGSICSLFLKNDNLNHELFHLISFKFEKFQENKAPFDRIGDAHKGPMCKQIFMIENE